MEDKQLDQYLNSLLDEQRFAATDANWNRFATFKNEQEIKNKKTFPFAWILNSLLVLLAVGGSYAYYHTTNAIKQTPQIATKQTTTINNIANTNSENNIPISASKQQISNKILASTINKNPQQKTKSYPKPIHKITNTIPIQYGTNGKSSNRIINESFVTAKEKKAEMEQRKTDIKIENQNQKTVENKLPVLQNKQEKDLGSTTQKIYNPRYLYNSVNEKLASASAINNTNENRNIAAQSEKNEKIKEVEKTEMKQTVIASENNSIINKTSNNIVIQDKTIAEMPPKLDVQKKIYDYDAENADWLLYVHADASINQGLQGNYSTHKNWNVAPHFSLDLHKRINEKMTINIGLGYSYNNALNTQYQKRISKYYFGRDTANFTVQYSNYYFVSLPIGVQYNINSWLHATTGLGITYMLDMKSNLYDKTYGLRTAYGYGTGFNRTDAYATVGVGVKISTRFTANAQYHYGFTDITKNDYFLNTITDKQRRIHIGFAYLITTK
jgi:Outer membrane protein beta-barrel domain